MKNMKNSLAVKIIMVFVVLLLAAQSNIEAKAANLSSKTGDVTVIYYHPTDSFKVTSRYQKKRKLNGKVADHNGEDYAAKEGSNVYASAPGVVTTVTYSSSAGNYIVIRHADGSKTRYLHLQKALVSVGDIVRVGDVIAKSGATGNVTGPHLHFEIINKNGVKVDPNDYVVRIRACDVKVPTGYTRIMTMGDNKCLRLDESNGLVVANLDPMDKRQVFKIEKYGDYQYVITNYGTGTAIDIAWGSHDNGNAIIGHPLHCGQNQTYDIVYSPSAGGFYIISGVSGDAGKDMVIDISTCDPNLVGSVVHLWEKIDPYIINQVYGFRTVSYEELKAIDGPIPPVYSISFDVGNIGTIKKGKCKNVTGTVRADVASDTITEVYACIKDLNGNVLYQSTDYVNKAFLNLKASNANNKAAAFNKLSSKGNYYFCMTAKSSMGGYAEYSTMFTIN